MAVQVGPYADIESTLREIQRGVLDLGRSAEVWDLPRQHQLRMIAQDLLGVIATVHSFDDRSRDPQGAMERDAGL